MANNKNIKIKVEDLTLIFGKRKTEALGLLEKGFSKTEILEKTKCTVGINKASFEIEEGEIFVIMGLSGSGKSTLIRCLNIVTASFAGPSGDPRRPARRAQRARARSRQRSRRPA